MATYTARTPVVNADSFEAIQTQYISLASTRTIAALSDSRELISPLSAPTVPIRMRGTWPGGVVWWDSLDGQPDTTGRFYRTVSPTFAELTSIVIVGS